MCINKPYFANCLCGYVITSHTSTQYCICNESENLENKNTNRRSEKTTAVRRTAYRGDLEFGNPSCSSGFKHVEGGQ